MYITTAVLCTVLSLDIGYNYTSEALLIMIKYKLVLYVFFCDNELWDNNFMVEVLLALF